MPSLCLQLEISRNSHPGLPWRDLIAPEPADAKLLVNLDLVHWVIGKRKPRLGDTTFGEAARPAAALSPGRFPTARLESERLVPGHPLPLNNGSTPPACPASSLLLAASAGRRFPQWSRPGQLVRIGPPAQVVLAGLRKNPLTLLPNREGGPLPKAPIARGEELLEALAGGRGDPNSSTFGKMGKVHTLLDIGLRSPQTPSSPYKHGT